MWKKNACTFGITRAVLTLLGFSYLVTTGSYAAARGEFRVFDAMLFSEKPNLGTYGLVPIRVVDSHTLWSDKAFPDAEPDVTSIQATLANSADPSGALVIDIENWPLSGPPSIVAATTKKYLTTLSRFRQFKPELRFGYYGVVPIRDYWRAIGSPTSPGYKKWQAENDALRPIANSVDLLFPSLYTFYPDQEGWRAFALANLAEARRLAPDKPIYCFLWPQFHDSGPRPYAFISESYWRMELETCHRHADGIVIWGGFTRTSDKRFHMLPWDGRAPWWRATQEFLNKLKGTEGN